MFLSRKSFPLSRSRSYWGRLSQSVLRSQQTPTSAPLSANVLRRRWIWPACIGNLTSSDLPYAVLCFSPRLGSVYITEHKEHVENRVSTIMPNFIMKEGNRRGRTSSLSLRVWRTHGIKDRDWLFYKPGCFSCSNLTEISDCCLEYFLPHSGKQSF